MTLPQEKKRRLQKAISKWINTGIKIQKHREQPEKEIQTAILQYLRSKHIFCFRNNTGVAITDHGHYSYGSVGSPDIIAVIDGKFIGIEVKSKKGKQSHLQKRWQEELEKAGGMYILARSIDDVMNKL